LVVGERFSVIQKNVIVCIKLDQCL